VALALEHRLTALSETGNAAHARDRLSSLTEVRNNTAIWVAVAFCGSAGAAIAAVAMSRHRDISAALAMSARVAFLFFWPAYVGGALVCLFGDVFLPLKAHARDFGLAFAAAILVHLGLVVRLCVVGPAPSAGTFVIFGTAALFACLLTLLSIDRVRQMVPPPYWRPILFVAMNYIVFAFLLDFARFPLGDLRQDLAYIPFLTLAIIGPALRLAAWTRAELFGLGPGKIGSVKS
jgi:hypothetical protein